MITAKDLYNVLTAVVPLYVAMILAYGSVKWWKIFTPDQCSGINRFVAIFAVPLLSFHFISTNNIYAMNYRFIAADSLQKGIVLLVLGVWAKFAKRGSLEWMITLFALSTLPNTLVMGIPLLKGMYGEFSGSLMVQVVVLQSVIWYTLMMVLFEYRGAKILIMEQFPESGAEITSLKVDSDIVSLHGREPLQTFAEVRGNGKLRVTVSRSRSQGFGSLPSLTPRASNLTGAEIFSLQSSCNPTPRGSSFNHDFYTTFSGSHRGATNMSPRHSNYQSADMYSLNSSRGLTPRNSNFEEEGSRGSNYGRFGPHHSISMPPYRLRPQKSLGRSMTGVTESYPSPNPGILSPDDCKTAKTDEVNPSVNQNPNEANKEVHMLGRSSGPSTISEANQLEEAADNSGRSDPKAEPLEHHFTESKGMVQESSGSYQEFASSPAKKGIISDVEMASPNSKLGSSVSLDEQGKKQMEASKSAVKMPPAKVMTRLIFVMVWRKLIRNPNTYACILGLTWSLVAYRWNIKMPKLVYGSIAILSDAGLGMAMFSLGLFMALQPRIIACGKSVAAFAMAVRFITGPAVMVAASIPIGLRGKLLHVAIVQAALPQGIVPFVFAKEYNVHPEILSTAVIFGMLIALPITVLYYLLMGL
ncbi:hypothetical protein SUGI_0531120 [Cryptomeria japonica]|uniref:auxin efflux carrier component 1a n=1 Tax=Cryptomeria japonica TaxID=3369 RepID=UPI002408A191|nr:auxin efflux carrier component 1a [Cryptomeria japonica]GLJ27089.1 hypothetical protein SUGI_0531120 [Cryptomeria japonica]